MTNKLIKKDPFDESIDDVMSGMIVAMFAVMMIQMLPVVQSAQQYYQGQQYQGLTESTTLTATAEQQSYEPDTPWVSAYVINDGPSTAYVGANKPSSLAKLYSGEATNLNFLGADRRIDAIFYRTDTGTATLRVTGQY